MTTASRCFRMSRLLLATVAASFLLAGCTADEGEPDVIPVELKQIAIHGNMYSPQSAQMTAGGTLQFENHDPHAHTATMAGLDSGDIAGNGGQHEFDDLQPGSYTFSCRHHASMQVTVTVA